MKRTNYFTLAALAVLSLAGCTQDDERAAGLPMTGMPMRVVAHVDAPVTREAMTTNDLDHYYFRVTDQDGAATPEYDHFVEMTKGEDGQWNASEEMKWGTAYPKVSALEQKGVDWSEDVYTGGGIVSVHIDQSTRDNLLESDLLYMPPTNITAENLDADGNILVNLKHRFAKLNVVVNITGTTSNPITALTIGGTKTQAYFTPESNTLEAIGDATDITAYRESTEARTDAPGCTATYECILIPQTVAANTLEVTATLDEGSKSYTYDKALTLKENCQYTLTLSMTYNGTLKPSDNINVGNWGDEEETGEGELEEGAQIENGTYIVKNAKGLLEWAQAAAQGNSPSLTLTADIDMKGRSWPIILNYSGGTINGQGYTISNLTLTRSDVASGTATRAGLITGTASSCTIKNLTLWKPNAMHSNFGFFVGYEAEGIYMENCHVVSGSCNQEISLASGGLVAESDDKSTYIACSVVSSNVGLCGEYSEAKKITACYVFGSTLGNFTPDFAEHWLNEDCSNSYYQQTADGSITGVGSSSAVSDWTGAMNAMNGSLGGQTYQWVENTVTDDDPRPLIIQDKPTN